MRVEAGAWAGEGAGTEFDVDLAQSENGTRVARYDGDWGDHRIGRGAVQAGGREDGNGEH